MKSSTSELISSVRSQHQALVTLCLTLILVMALSRTPDIYSAALADLETVMDLTSSETWDPLFLQTILWRRDQGDVLTYESAMTITFNKEELSKFNKPIAPTHVIEINYPDDIFLEWDYFPEFAEPPYGVAEPRVDAPKTLLEFIHVWTKAANVKAITVIRLFNYAYVQRTPEFPVEKVDLTKGSAGVDFAQTGIITPNIFRPADVEERDQDFYGLTTWDKDYYYYSAWKFWIPALTLDRDQFDAREYFCELMERATSICKQPFEQMFPDLYLATKNVQDVPLGQVKVFLERERMAQLSRLELLGIKIPIEITNIGGMLAIVAMQIYLLAHLLQLQIKETTSDQELPPWIGLFGDRLSHAFTVLSMVVLPSVTGIYLQIATLEAIISQQNQIVVILLIAANVSISFLILKKLLELWKITTRNINAATPYSTKKKNKS